MPFFRWLRQLLVVLVPFGLLSKHKPRHYREMLRVLWENRGRWLYALCILRHGVCDGCSRETVQKAIAAGVPGALAISAPSLRGQVPPGRRGLKAALG